MIDISSLLHSERPELSAEQVTLVSLELDSPLSYCLEVDDWASLNGAIAQINLIGTRIRALFQQARVKDFLYAETTRWFALVESAEKASEVIRGAEREAAAISGILTISSVIETVPVRTLFEGLYPAPQQVVGVPGVTPYQLRINRYFGLLSSSTIPTPEQANTRRHFGQLLEHMRARMLAARDSKQIFPFYETLPFVALCTLCHKRPVEHAQNMHCSVCERRLNAATHATPWVGFLTFRLPEMDKLLREQQTPAAYRKLFNLIQQAIQKAISASNLDPILINYDSGLVAFTGKHFFSGVPALSSQFSTALRDHLKIAPALVIGVAVGQSKPSHLYAAAESALEFMMRANDQERLAIHTPGYNEREPVVYSLDGLSLLEKTVNRVKTLRLPDDLYTEFPLQIARGTASLYYEYGRMRLDDRTRRSLDDIEGDWGRESVRFYRALHDSLVLARMMEHG